MFSKDFLTLTLALALALGVMALPAHADWITGPSNEDWRVIFKALDRCRPGTTLDELEEQPNSYSDYLRGWDRLDGTVFHNFNLRLHAGEVLFLRGAVVLSGAFHVERGARLALDGAVLGNLTFHGDLSGVTVEDACLVNADFRPAWNFSRREIPGSARYSKNLRF